MTEPCQQGVSSIHTDQQPAATAPTCNMILASVNKRQSCAPPRAMLTPTHLHIGLQLAACVALTASASCVPALLQSFPPEKPLAADKETGVPFPQLCHAQCPCPEAMTSHQCTADLSPAATTLLQGGLLIQLMQALLLLKQKQLD